MIALIRAFVRACPQCVTFFTSALALGACASSTPPAFDVLRDSAPLAQHTMRNVPLEDPAEYLKFMLWGESWFRNETFGGERSTTDVAGLFDADVEIPCPASGQAPDPNCRQKVSTLPYFVRALDALDGVPGNLFQGNGGVLGNGYTSDLVLEFPPGTTLAGLPVPEHLHTGLDVDAGYPWPIGIVAVKASVNDEQLPYLVEPSQLGVGPVKEEYVGKFRLGITCALCHYSLDVDKDGHPDLRSSRWGEVTPGSPWQPQNAWGIGNQDVHFGWLFALTRNPLLGFTVLSGPIGKNTPADALEFVRWVKENYRRAPEATRREVIRGMLAQPRGLADDTPNALHDANQLPILFTNHNWPYNFDGSFSDPSDRNNGVWTGAIDFTGLIALASDRSSGRQAGLFWEPTSVYSVLTAEEYADIMVDRSPALAYAPERRRALKDDILGYSDGIPGMLDPNSVVLMKSPLGSLPQRLFNHPDNITHNRIRTPEQYGGDAAKRGSVMVLLGTRVVTTPTVRAQFGVDQIVKNHPGLNSDDFESDAVTLMLDWLTPPPNRSALLANARALVARGYEIFKQSGCANCHSGPFLTNNRVQRLYDRRRDEIGVAAPSTAGFRAVGRGTGPALGSAPFRSLANRPLQLYVAPPYDPETGLATSEGSPICGLLGPRPVGYKTLTLRYLWGSAPYLHDGGVAVALKPEAAPAGNDLKALLSRPASDKWYGMGTLLAYREEHQSGEPWPNAALSLQALLLASERAKVVADNNAPLMPVAVGFADNPLQAPAKVPLTSLGVQGRGHEFWIDDVPGGDRVTALVAFLLALDDAPGELP